MDPLGSYSASHSQGKGTEKGGEGGEKEGRGELPPPTKGGGTNAPVKWR